MVFVSSPSNAIITLNSYSVKRTSWCLRMSPFLCLSFFFLQICIPAKPEDVSPSVDGGDYNLKRYTRQGGGG